MAVAYGEQQATKVRNIAISSKTTVSLVVKIRYLFCFQSNPKALGGVLRDTNTLARKFGTFSVFLHVDSCDVVDHPRTDARGLVCDARSNITHHPPHSAVDMVGISFGVTYRQ